MHPFPEITAADVIHFPGRQYIVDGLWSAEFGREIEYQYRVIPEHLIYLLYKYGPVIPHSFFLESIQEICAETKRAADSNELETQPLSKDRANQLIEEAVALGLITVVTPKADRRFRLYKISALQLEKLRRIRVRERSVFDLLDRQAADPANPQAGRTDENARWYRNIIPALVQRHNDIYNKDKAMLDKLRYLLSGFVIGATVYLSQIVDALATISGGSK
jgi:hypothetical protein